MTPKILHGFATISIGMPVYNGEAVVGAAIESILGQSYTDFELIISDNASTDDTKRICEAFARQDSRIRYERQPVNIGVGKNYQFVFEQSRGEYFMWAAADDFRSPGYIEKNLKILQSNSEYGFSSSSNCFEGEEDQPDKLKTFSIEGSLHDRLSSFIDHCWFSHACFYSIFRREILDGCPEILSEHLASDWSVDVHLLMKGAFSRELEERLIIGRGGMSSQPNYVAKTRTKPIHYVLPFYEYSKKFTIELVHSNELKWREKVSLVFKLCIFNGSFLLNRSRVNVVKLMKLLKIKIAKQ